MAKHPAKSLFTPRYPKKYLGANVNHIVARSGWERSVMTVFDEHPAISWASEAVRIPYRHPLTGRQTIYIPDFFVLYKDDKGIEHRELIEVKPSDEVPGYRKKVSKLKEARQIVNAAKWQAAKQFCESRNWLFRIATEHDLFKRPQNKSINK